MMNFKEQRGFVLLLSALIASLMASLGIAMFTIAQKEVRLSSTGRDSQFAFYAADAGAECALYLHYVHDAFATSTVTTDMKCGGQILQENGDSQSDGLGGSSETKFKYDLTSSSGKKYCISVRVEKFPSGFPSTRINSLGYNVSCDSRSSSSRVLERAVHMEL